MNASPLSPLPDPPAYWAPLITGLATLLEMGAVVQVTRPDGQTGYAPAPPLPCPTCGGTGFDWDVDFELSGLCPDCGGTGIEELFDNRLAAAMECDGENEAWDSATPEERADWLAQETQS